MSNDLMRAIYDDANILCSFMYYLIEDFIEPVHNRAAISMYYTDFRDMSFIHLTRDIPTLLYR